MILFFFQKDDIIIDNIHISAESFKNHCITDSNPLKMLTSFIWICGTEDACRIINWKHPAFIKKIIIKFLLIIQLFWHSKNILVLMVYPWYKIQCPLFIINSGNQKRYHVDPYQLFFFRVPAILNSQTFKSLWQEGAETTYMHALAVRGSFGAAMQFSSRVTAVPPSNGESPH